MPKATTQTHCCQRSRVRSSHRWPRRALPPPPAPSPPALRVALVCTMRDNAASLDSFVVYYLWLGVTTLFLYVDDPSDAAVAIAWRYDAVHLRVRDASLHRDWQRQPSWARLGLYAATEVQARQALNAEHAMERALALGLDFLLHVDSDELLYLPTTTTTTPPGSTATGSTQPRPPSRPGAALGEHTKRLQRLGCLQFTYRNLEAVPELEACDDPFACISLFKQHPAELDHIRTQMQQMWQMRQQRQSAATSKAAAAATAALDTAVVYWTGAEGGGGGLFRFYTNGKSMMRVCPEVREAASVHEFRLPAAELERGRTNNRQLQSSSYVPHRRATFDGTEAAVLLHFAVCDFGTFWRKRWAALGYASPNHRFRGVGGGLDQRANLLATSARRDEALQLYRSTIMLGDADEIARQLATGVCLRLGGVTRCVRQGRALFLPASAASQQPTLAEAEPPSTTPQQRRTTTTPQLPPWLSERRTRALREMTLRLAQAASDLAGRGGGNDDLRSTAALAVREATAEAMAMAADAVQRRRCDGDDGEQARAQIARVLGDGSGANGSGGRGSGTKDGGGGGVDSGDGGDGDGDGALYARLFSAMLPRVASEALSLLPLPSRTTFDLAGYCAHPLAAAAVTAEVAASLLTKGAAVLPPLTIAPAAASSSSSSPSPSSLSSLMARLRAESVAALSTAASTAASNATTMRCDANRLLVVSTEAPPRAPAASSAALPAPATASVAAAAAETLCGASLTLSAAAHPALLEAIRLLRGVGEALERTLDLRLALPLTAVLCAYGDGGAAPTLPPNSGWPDSGVEIAISLVLPAAGATTAAEPIPAATTLQAARSAANKEAGSGAGVSPDADGRLRQTVEARTSDGACVACVAACAAAGGGGGVLLTLARQTRCFVPPAAAASPPTASASAHASTSALASVSPSPSPSTPPAPLLVLTLFAYSACRRASDGAIRFLGVDPRLVPS